MGEVLGTIRLSDALINILASRLRVIFKDGEALSTDKHTGRVIHSFLAHPASVVDQVPSTIHV